jgi:hypothetical protein
MVIIHVSKDFAVALNNVADPIQAEMGRVAGGCSLPMCP